MLRQPVLDAIAALRPTLVTLDHERLVALDADTGAVRWQVEGSQAAVSVPQDEDHDNLVTVHNHPIECTPSYPDLLVTVWCRWTAMVVVTEGHTYTVRPSPDFQGMADAKRALHGLKVAYARHQPEDAGPDRDCAWTVPAFEEALAVIGATYTVEAA